MSVKQLLYILIVMLIPSHVPASTIVLDTCVDYGCDQLKRVYLPESVKMTLAERFAATDNAVAERRVISDSIGWIEEIVGSLNGTWRDKGGNPADVDPPGQLDCIAESSNTESYLNLIDQFGLLKWHRVEARTVRHRYIFATHWTAVITDKETGISYAVDSWYDDNGEAARIIPLDSWYDGVEQSL